MREKIKIGDLVQSTDHGHYGIVTAIYKVSPSPYEYYGAYEDYVVVRWIDIKASSCWVPATNFIIVSEAEEKKND